MIMILGCKKCFHHQSLGINIIIIVFSIKSSKIIKSWSTHHHHLHLHLHLHQHHHHHHHQDDQDHPGEAGLPNAWEGGAQPQHRTNGPHCGRGAHHHQHHQHHHPHQHHHHQHQQHFLLHHYHHHYHHVN